MEKGYNQLCKFYLSGGKMMNHSLWKSYRFPIILLFSIILGAVIGFLFGESAVKIKPLGDLFLNLLFMIVIPLVFFSISSAIAKMGSGKRFGKIMLVMMIVFLATGIIASVVTILGAKVFPPAEGVNIALEKGDVSEKTEPIATQIVNTVTVSDFTDLFSRSNMLALIVFSVLLGLSVSLIGEKGKTFAAFLESGNEAMLKMVKIVMYYAPIGLGAYFAALIGEFGPSLMGSYFRAVLFYYPLSILYFFIFFTIYALIAVGRKGIWNFWKNMFEPSITALGTCSSAASIPVNLKSTKNMGVTGEVANITIPLGATLHKDGSVMGGVLKIMFVFSIFDIQIEGLHTYLLIIGLSLLVGMVMGAIPQGGMIGEMLILSLFGLPVEALPILAAVSAIIDPPATLVNVAGDNVASMLVDKFTKRDKAHSV